MTASLIAKLSETAKAALCYLAQEPDAYVSIMKETSSLTKKQVVSGASVHNADGKAATYTSGGEYPNKASLAALLTKGLIECILPPKCAVDQPRFRNAYASFQYANLSDKGRKVAEALLAEEKPPLTETAQLLLARQNCDSDVKLHQVTLDREQRRYDASVAMRDKAQDAYVASTDFFVLNAPQEAILAVCLAPENRNRNIILLGTDASRPILRMLATELSAGGNAKDVWYVTHESQSDSPSTLRPTTIIADSAGKNDYAVYRMKRVLRTGGRFIMSTEIADDANSFKLDDPLVINVKDCH